MDIDNDFESLALSDGRSVQVEFNGDINVCIVQDGCDRVSFKLSYPSECVGERRVAMCVHGCGVHVDGGMASMACCHIWVVGARGCWLAVAWGTVAKRGCTHIPGTARRVPRSLSVLRCGVSGARCVLRCAAL